MKKNFKHCIITDAVGKPMVWDEYSKQLVYCTDEHWQDDHTPVRMYSKLRARQLINKTINNREKWKMSPGAYKLMPFEVGNAYSYWNTKLK